MIVHKRGGEQRHRSGKGLINQLINKLPVELHVPGYQYCGPGTKLKERLARGDSGINPLDAACKQHDIAYSRNRENLAARHEADKVLAEKAWQRVFAKDASVAEKAVAWGVTNTMKAKRKLGMGISKKKTTPKACGNRDRKKVSLKKIIKAARGSMRSGGTDPVKSALKGARAAVKTVGGRSKVQTPRILPIPTKIGGFLPLLIPLFAGLSAAGALAGGAAGITKAVNDANAAKRELLERQRHNEKMEAIALGKGLYLKPYKTGLGLHLNSKNM